MFASELEHPLSWSRVILDSDDTVAGYLIARFYGDIWHIMDFAVRTELRGRGFGTELLDHFLASSQPTGADYTLEVRRSNLDAMRLYESRGFAVVGVRVGYYPDTDEDALVMRRPSRLPEPPSERV